MDVPTLRLGMVKGSQAGPEPTASPSTVRSRLTPAGTLTIQMGERGSELS